jgi:heterodisulfide reductase subunit C
MMKETSTNGKAITDPSFLETVKKFPGGDKVTDCIQCGICSGSCPARPWMDYSPMQILRMIQLGLKEKALSTSTIWICASCYACTTRCPRGIDIPILMSNLKRVAMEEKVPAKIRMKPLFHRSFMETIQKHGRMYEPEIFMAVADKRDLRALMHNVSFGLRLMRKGKVGLPPKVPELDEFLAVLRKHDGGKSS